MAPELWLRLAYRPALAFLPARMDSERATVLVLAICLQESRLRHRRQVGGAALGYAQFEPPAGAQALDGLLTHPASAEHVERLAERLDYPDADAAELHAALEHNDILCAGLARLLVWTLPDPLPTESEGGWDQYIRAWRPGKPHPETWAEMWGRAVEVVTHG